MHIIFWLKLHSGILINKWEHYQLGNYFYINYLFYKDAYLTDIQFAMVWFENNTGLERK